MVERSKRQLRSIVVDIDAEQRRIYLEGLHQLEAKLPVEQVPIVLLDDGVVRLGQMLILWEIRVVHDDPVGKREPRLDVVAAEVVVDAAVIEAPIRVKYEELVVVAFLSLR